MPSSLRLTRNTKRHPKLQHQTLVQRQSRWIKSRKSKQRYLAHWTIQMRVKCAVDSVKINIRLEGLRSSPFIFLGWDNVFHVPPHPLGANGNSPLLISSSPLGECQFAPTYLLIPSGRMSIRPYVANGISQRCIAVATSFLHSFIPSFLHFLIPLILAPARWLRVAPPPFTGLSAVSFGSFRFAPFPKRMPLPSLARADW
jgi:hypothetical protein